MKKTFLFIGTVLFIANLSFSQDCAFYYPKTKGAVLEYTNYDAKQKITGINKSEIKEVTISGNSISALISAVYYDKDQKEVSKNEFTAKCENGVFYLDMKNFMSPESMSAYKDMEVTMESTDLEFPSSLKVGDQMKDGSFTMTITNAGMKFMTLTTTITNRKVEAKETITTPAGSFECFKITSDVISKSIMSVSVKSVYWYALNVGMIKSESYQSNGKLLGTTVLTSLK